MRTEFAFFRALEGVPWLLDGDKNVVHSSSDDNGQRERAASRMEGLTSGIEIYEHEK
jgi:hypothetical protein